MDTRVVGFNWLTSGGAYAIIAFVWIASAVLVGNYAIRLGRRYDSPNDGCLLAISTQVLVLLGGGAGILSAPFPWFILTSAIGAVGVPLAACAFFRWRMRKYLPGR